MLKRVFDTIASLLLVLLLLPVILATALAIVWLMGAPVLFRQQRPGLHGQPFEVLKFRTMAEATGTDGHPLPDEARLTKLGVQLRRFSLDELPQLFNVIRGDMSLVGPRPLLMEYLPLYSAEQRRRHDVRPGITGWTQVNGRNALSWESKFDLDVWYVDHRSFWLDLKILAMTAGRVFSGSGVSKEGFATTEKFRGTADE
ncbi:MAG: sugar transferase [Betaproteobacteria bacterium]|jgi:lipopolysaccharide/colanic/teichoic acid biosynthesis glycosyltransferase|nr:sugar transferase [Betaproteobacteria bacterium]